MRLDIANKAGVLMGLLRTVTHGMRYDFDQRFQDQLGLTFPQVIVLRVLAAGNVYPTSAEVVERLELAPSTVSGILTRLTRAGFVAREEDPADLRVSRWAVTEEGRSMLEAANRVYHDYISSRLECLNSQEVDTLIELMKKLQAATRELEGSNIAHEE